MMVAIFVLMLFGIVFAMGLAVASEKFYVAKNPLIEEIQNILPGLNCGACGFPGCAGISVAIADRKVAPDSCPVCSSEAINKIYKILGIDNSEIREKKVARLICSGGLGVCNKLAEYVGPKSCKIMDSILGGGKACKFSCIGAGDCANVCPVGAISFGNEELPKINPDICIACSKCVKNCPRSVIELKPISKSIVVRCSSQDKGIDVKKACSKGCIGCSICAKNCPEDAITINNSLAKIDPEKCIMCGKCAEKCPTKAIEIIC